MGVTQSGAPLLEKRALCKLKRGTFHKNLRKRGGYVPIVPPRFLRPRTCSLLFVYSSDGEKDAQQLEPRACANLPPQQSSKTWILETKFNFMSFTNAVTHTSR